MQPVIDVKTKVEMQVKYIRANAAFFRIHLRYLAGEIEKNEEYRQLEEKRNTARKECSEACLSRSRRYDYEGHLQKVFFRNNFVF